jgi:hypothetical protein
MPRAGGTVAFAALVALAAAVVSPAEAHAEPAEAGPSPVAASTRYSLESSSRPVRPLTWVAGGLAIAGLVTAGIVTLTAQSAHDVWWDQCGQAGTCAPGHTDRSSHTQYVIAGTALGVGVVALGTAIVSAVTTPRNAPSTSLLAGLSVAPDHGGALAGWTQRF